MLQRYDSTMLEQRIEQQFIDSADLKYQSAQTLSKPIAAAVGALLMCVTGGGKIAQVLRETDVHVCVPHERTARIQEVHLLVLHCLCDGVDSQLLGEQENPS